jgi:putative colanic acid biosynthesis acetyltransferase WcaF
MTGRQPSDPPIAPYRPLPARPLGLPAPDASHILRPRKGKTSMESTGSRFDRQMPRGERWPYPGRVYLMRVVWAVAWRTIWKLSWWRIHGFRTGILRLFGAKAGSSAICGSAWIELPWDLEIGKGCVIGPRVQLYNLGGLSIGDHTVISQDAYVCGGTHDYSDPTYPLIRKKIVIGRHVWIAAGAFIHPGITIGDGAVVGARAVVSADVPPWTVVAGNPAKVIKRRTLKGISPDSMPPASPTPAPAPAATQDAP